MEEFLGVGEEPIPDQRVARLIELGLVEEHSLGRRLTHIGRRALAIPDMELMP